MRPWMGAVAVAAAACWSCRARRWPGEDDPAQIQFKLDSSAQIADFEALGLDMRTTGVTKNGGRQHPRQRVGDRRAARDVRAHGFEPVATSSTTSTTSTRIRAERNETLAKLKAAPRTRCTATASRRRARARAGDIHAQRADYYENNGGRWLSIEANADGARYTGTRHRDLHRPDRHGRDLRRGGQQASATPSTVGIYSDPDVNPRYYQYHTQTVRLGDPPAAPARRHARPSVKIASSNGTWTRSPSRNGSPRTRPGTRQGFKRGFVTHYNEGSEAYQKMRDLAAEFPNISEAIKLPEKTHGLPAQARRRCSATTRTAPYVTFDASNLPVAGASPATGAHAGRHGRADLEGLRATWAATASRPRSSPRPRARPTRR